MCKVVGDEKPKTVEETPSKIGVDTNKKKQGRGRSQGSTGRGRGSSKTQTSPLTVSSANGHLDNSNCKVMFYLHNLYLQSYSSFKWLESTDNSSN